MLNRRAFIKIIGSIPLITALSSLSIPSLQQICKFFQKHRKPQSDVVQSLVKPIRRSLEWQAFSRKILLVDELPMGALQRYERDVAAAAAVLQRRDR